MDKECCSDTCIISVESHCKGQLETRGDEMVTLR
jgi:hypothetical protein